MLKRKAYTSLESWKDSLKLKNRALLVAGARQVGKTYLIRAFARQHFENVVEINLVENEDAKNSFRQASNSADLMFRISAASSSPLVPHKTLIFIDEVQECPDVVRYIKFLVQDNQYSFILSGSMLGVELEVVSSQPVGYMSNLTMYPLDFEEFCWSAGLGSDVIHQARLCFQKREPLPDFLHERLNGLFHRYLLIGGMPDAVLANHKTNSLEQVRNIQDEIVNYYAQDIGKYAPAERRLMIKNIYRLIPSELLNQNKRFRISSIEDVKRFDQVKEDFLWLTMANMALAAHSIDAPTSPLLAAENSNFFKLFLSDVGLLASRYPKSSLLGVLDGKPKANMGGIYENFIIQELVSHGYVPRYFSKRKIGEIDFVLERKDGGILALEIKSGGSYKSHAALNNALAVPNYDISEALVFAETNIEKSGVVTYFPAYCIAFLEYDE